jgi:ATP-dependent Clp protease ATP-binding subunit ClpA
LTNIAATSSPTPHLSAASSPSRVEEPNLEETIQILHAVKAPYEDHHQLKITDEAIEAAAKLSTRYVTERFLPDKAIDLIDESASRVRMYKSCRRRKSFASAYADAARTRAPTKSAPRMPSVSTRSNPCRSRERAAAARLKSCAKRGEGPPA